MKKIYDCEFRYRGVLSGVKPTLFEIPTETFRIRNIQSGPAGDVPARSIKPGHRSPMISSRWRAEIGTDQIRDDFVIGEKPITQSHGGSIDENETSQRRDRSITQASGINLRPGGSAA
jgi:hypothetical protein